MNTSRLGSRPACHDRQRRRLRATSARACSRANSVFFEPLPLVPQKQPHGIVRDTEPSRGQFVLQPMQGQMGRLPDPFQDEGSMRLEHPLAVSAHLARRDRASPPVALRPLHRRGNRNSEPGCSRSTALTTQNRSNDTLTQIIRKRSGHQMLASNPANILNHNSPVGGIPSDSINLGNALVPMSGWGQRRKCSSFLVMSALPHKADIVLKPARGAQTCTAVRTRPASPKTRR